MGRSPAYRRIDTLAPNNLSDNPNSLIQLKMLLASSSLSSASLTNGKMHLVSVRIQRRSRSQTKYISYPLNMYGCILSSLLCKLPDARPRFSALQNTTTFWTNLQRTSNRVFIIPWWNGDVFLENQAKYYFRPQIDEVTKLYIKAHNHKHCGKPDIRIHPL